MNRLNILNANIVRPNEIIKASIGVSKGKIVEIEEDSKKLSPAENTLNIEGNYLLPGMIDSHVHIRGGKFSYREDFISGSRAAAKGGVTCFFEMPVCDPPASTVSEFNKRKKEIDEEAYIDFALYGGAGIDNLDEIEGLHKAGAVAFKTFTMPPVPGREKEFYGLCAQNEYELTKVMERIASTNSILVVHSELNEYVNESVKKAIREGKDGLKAFCEARSEKAEIAAVEMVISACEKTGCKTIIAHVSSFKSMDLINEAKSKGIDIHAETCPQYLLFNENTAEKAGVFARIKPPYRDEYNQNKLIDYYSKGFFETTGSDHAPYLYEEKLQNGSSIWDTVDGLPGIELSLSLLLNLVYEKRISLKNLALNLSANPAKLFGLYPKKGLIDVGFDADLVVVEENKDPYILKKDNLFTKSKKSAVLYDGMPIHYDIKATICRGEIVYKDGIIVGERAWGKNVML